MPKYEVCLPRIHTVKRMNENSKMKDPFPMLTHRLMPCADAAVDAPAFICPTPGKRKQGSMLSGCYDRQCAPVARNPEAKTHCQSE